MSWRDLPRSGFHQLPTRGTEKKGYVTGTEVIDRLVAVWWGPEALDDNDETTINARVLECVKMLVAAAEEQLIEGFVEYDGEMRPLRSTDWSERTLEEWEYDLRDSEIDRSGSSTTRWAHGKTLMFEREPTAEWIKTFALDQPKSPTSMPRFSRADVEAAYRKRVESWPVGERHPSREDDVMWMNNKFGVSRATARKIRTKCAPKSWQRGGAPKSA